MMLHKKSERKPLILGLLTNKEAYGEGNDKVRGGAE
jgi:hypothetical protein